MKIALLILGISVFSFSVHARVITWAEAIEFAQKNSDDLQAAESQYKSVLELERSGYSPFMPRVNASARGSHSGSNTTDTSSHSYSADLNLSQNLFSGFADASSLKIKKLNSQQALIDLNNTKARISQELKQTFAETYFAQENAKLSESILKRREENLRSVQLQYEGGRENKGSFLLSQSNVELARLDILRARNNSETTADNFRKYLGLPQEEVIELQTNIPQDDFSAQAPDFKELVQNHNTVMRAQNDEEISRANLDVSRSGFSPSLDLGANYGYTGSKFFPDQNQWGMSLTLTVPLFDGLRDYSSFQSNSYKLKASSSALMNVRLTLLKDLKLAYFGYIEAAQEEKVNDGFNRAALLRAEIARNKYKNGLLSFEDWDIIETDLIQKQKNALTSEKNRIIKQSQWEKAQAVGVLK